MSELSDELLQIAYDGTAISSGRMPMLELANGLRGQALLIRRVCHLFLEVEISAVRVEVDPSFEEGSFIAPVHILVEGYAHARDFLASPAVTAVANLMQLLGFFGVSGASLYAIFVRRNGREIRNVRDIDVQLPPNIPAQVFLEIYNDREVQKQIRRTLQPLRSRGISEFTTRLNRRIVETVRSGDLAAVDQADLQNVLRDEDVDLGVEKAALRSDLEWHLNDGKSSFDASIVDPTFWKKVADGAAFASGDRMRARLIVTAVRQKSGGLKITRRIPTVHDVQRGRERYTQQNLFPPTDEPKS